MNFWLYLALIIFSIFYIAVFVYAIVFSFALLKKIAPPVHSGRRLRRAVVNQIATEFVDAKTILDVGSGWGTMVRTVARRFRNAKVSGVEIMRVPFLYSRIRGVFVKNSEIYFGDVFKFLKDSNKKFDVGITYLLPFEMKSVKDFLSRFKILFVLDFPLPDVVPTKKIKLHKDALGQHWLYVYKNEK